MKKVILLITISLFGYMIFAISYKNNTYQKLADQYTNEAQRAFDAGEYEKAQDYSQKAVENAQLSEAFIKKMVAKSNADTQMRLAANKLSWAKGIKADKNFPMAYTDGQKNYESSKTNYGNEDYVAAADFAKKVLTALADVREITPLPEFYIVRPWLQSKDCFWNISGRPYVYNNPLLWENLFQANKDNIPDSKNPNLILPGMKMKIPSLSGEYREGVYSPDKDYEPYNSEN